ncbi:MAG: tRNA (adenosine(37)-N6)-threonylcarbamoyltransferase complex dimerization subunit type 1 TsaB [Holosporaceae bacterium]|jgi:tRNA threonylcarbamoyl adenosine modification protein YeaZ|nr:tRNA (adenosine(37)-N6)-threonylcarbamoyltransferase complex dimerization subunit type 1 TsaB [Holosporaceae bacterium]
MKNKHSPKNNFLLAVTACLKRCSAAVFHDGIISEKNLSVDASSNFVSVVSDLLRESNINAREINGIITASGPGSFTGVRIAQSFTKGMAFSLKIPAVSVDYFEVIDSIFRQQCNNDFPRIIVIESEKNQLYFRRHEEKKFIYGVDSYENIESYVEKNNVRIIISNITKNLGEKAEFCIDDFRNARHLLSFSPLLSPESRVTPLYINASGSSIVQM